jgi:hypothetical protein
MTLSEWIKEIEHLLEAQGFTDIRWGTFSGYFDFNIFSGWFVAKYQGKYRVASLNIEADVKSIRILKEKFTHLKKALERRDEVVYNEDYDYQEYTLAS